MKIALTSKIYVNIEVQCCSNVTKYLKNSFL